MQIKTAYVQGKDTEYIIKLLLSLRYHIMDGRLRMSDREKEILNAIAEFDTALEKNKQRQDLRREFENLPYRRAIESEESSVFEINARFRRFRN